MNQITIIGRITATPVLKSTACGKSVTDFTVASKRGRDREKTDFIKCVAWEKTAEAMHQYVKKGDLLGVRGELQEKVWTREDGTTGRSYAVSAETVEFLTKAKGENDGYYESDPGPEFLSDDPLDDLE